MYLWPPGVAQGGLAKASLPAQVELSFLYPLTSWDCPRGLAQANLLAQVGGYLWPIGVAQEVWLRLAHWCK